jgi:hypothetical protein
MATVDKDFRVKHGLIVEGTNGTIDGSDIITEDAITGGTQTNISVTYNPTTKVVDFVAENGVADSTTDDLEEGTTNKYYSDSLVDDHLTGGDGISYSTGTISADLASGGGLNFDVNQIAIDRTTVDTWYDASGSASTAETNAKDYVDDLVGDATVDGTAGNTITDRIATAVSDLVDGAPELLNTLNELAAAINDDEGFSSTITTAIGEKVAKAGDTMTGALVLSGDPTLDLHAATKQYVDAAETAAKGYTDDLIGDATVDGTTGDTVTDRIATAKSEAIADAQTYADALTTADIAEDSGYLYFTDSRAVDALEAVVPNFTAVELNSVAKQIAATSSVSVPATAVAYAFAKAEYRSAEFLVKVAYGTHTEISKVMLTLDTSDNIAITEYAVVGTNGSASTISAGISGTDVQLLVTTVNASSTVTVSGTLLV